MTSDSQSYINREMSWLEFNQRVLDQAIDDTVPLLERLKFLAITSSNLDEFFMVRVGGLQLQREAGAASTDPSGMTVKDQLEAIHQRTSSMVSQQYDCFLNDLEAGLVQQGIERVSTHSASARHLESMKQVFDDQILAILSPMGISSTDQFPLLSSRALYLAVQLDVAEGDVPYRFAVIPMGKALPRILTLPTEQGFSYALLEDVVSRFASSYFPGEKILSTAAFRITRNADVGLQEDSAADLLHGMKDLLQQRKTANCVRLEIDEEAPDSMVKFLQHCLDVSDHETVRAPSPLDLSVLMELSGVEGFDYLRYESWTPQNSPQIDPSDSIFSTIADQDVLLCHPYESFEPVVRLIDEAADDPDVMAIKQTLYRTSRKSPIVGALRRAAERGKYVTAIVELKARFDEARNIEWARELEEAGVQVIYGVKNLKTHAKVCIVVRREPRGIVRYMHFGTGNYNESTARLYSDVSYMTCNDELGKDASGFFNAITGFSQPQPYQLLEAAPLGLRKKLLSLIDAEIQRKKQGQKAGIKAKLNSLVDPALIKALYRASQAGVKVQLNIRGICCLRPGVKGLSEKITVTSIVDRLLEHARIIYFRHGGDDLVFISSADWMPRNLDRRVELLVPIAEARCKKKLIGMLSDYFRDKTNTWQLQSDGHYQRLKTDGTGMRVQAHFQQASVEATKSAAQMRATVFEPHQPASQQTD